MTTNAPWELLSRLPNKIVRDIGFVLACPPLLLHSEEFPTVTDFSGLEWPRIAKWLEHLDTNNVEQWFAKARSNNRLGDHFAKCVEFVLRFSPVFQLKCLHCSQQVLQPIPRNVPIDEADGLQALGTVEKIEKHVKKRLQKQLRKQKYGKGIVTTVGEFDFLFQDEGTDFVQHWEVSVKYLLYVGPWEAFGLETPSFAKWANLTSRKPGNETSMVESSERFLGFFLGPHVGETLADRKKRLMNQMSLSLKAAASETLEVLLPREKDKLVVPKALLLGYLFYEPQLWTLLEAGCGMEGGLQHGLNGQHWRGWWMHAEEFESFATTAPRNESSWYIVPKEEWLSPIAITKENGNLLNVDGLLKVAEQVAGEASRKELPRMRRFMVAEMRPDCNFDWFEISRGFLVELSWPDTRMYSPVGFTPII